MIYVDCICTYKIACYVLIVRLYWHSVELYEWILTSNFMRTCTIYVMYIRWRVMSIKYKSAWNHWYKSVQSRILCRYILGIFFSTCEIIDTRWIVTWWPGGIFFEKKYLRWVSGIFFDAQSSLNPKFESGMVPSTSC